MAVIVVDMMGEECAKGNRHEVIKTKGKNTPDPLLGRPPFLYMQPARGRARGVCWCFCFRCGYGCGFDCGCGDGWRLNWC